MTVLIVEDDLTRALTLKKYLQMNSIKVITAEDGFGAMKILENEVPDLILSDANMPGMDGYSLVKNVKSDEHTKRIPFFLYSSRNIPQDNEQLAYRFGVNRCITNIDVDEIGHEALLAFNAI